MSLLGVGAIIESVGKVAGDLITTEKERRQLDLEEKKIDQATDLAFVDVEGEPVERHDAAEAHGDIVDFEQRHAGHGSGHSCQSRTVRIATSKSSNDIDRLAPTTRSASEPTGCRNCPGRSVAARTMTSATA